MHHNWSVCIRVALLAALTAPGCDRTPVDVAAPTDLNAQSPPPAAPADDLVARLHARLRAANPNYENDAQIRVENEQVVALELAGTGVIDISPLAGLPLRHLDLMQLPIRDLSPLAGMPLQVLYLDETRVLDLSPLAGMPLQVLYLNNTHVSDLSPLEGMPLEQLNLFGTAVSDVSPLRGMPLKTLWLRETPIEDFSPLEELSLESLDVENTAFGDTDLRRLRLMPLTRLNIAGTQVTDLTPLQYLQLRRLIFTPPRIVRGLEVVREMRTLTELDVTFRQPERLSPAEFWETLEANRF